MKEKIKLINRFGLKKFTRYNRYYKKKLKRKVIDIHIPYSDFYYPEDIGTIESCKMKSGKIGIYEITDMRGIDDWGSKNITKDFIGYKGVKGVRQCSLTEFMYLYDGFLITR